MCRKEHIIIITIIIIIIKHDITTLTRVILESVSDAVTPYVTSAWVDSRSVIRGRGHLTSVHHLSINCFDLYNVLVRALSLHVCKLVAVL